MFNALIATAEATGSVEPLHHAVHLKNLSDRGEFQDMHKDRWMSTLRNPSILRMDLLRATGLIFHGELLSLPEDLGEYISDPNREGITVEQHLKARGKPVELLSSSFFYPPLLEGQKLKILELDNEDLTFQSLNKKGVIDENTWNYIEKIPFFSHMNITTLQYFTKEGLKTLVEQRGNRPSVTRIEEIIKLLGLRFSYSDNIDNLITLESVRLANSQMDRTRRSEGEEGVRLLEDAFLYEYTGISTESEFQEVVKSGQIEELKNYATKKHSEKYGKPQVGMSYPLFFALKAIDRLQVEQNLSN